ncbi:MAG TPA: Mur ligase family protein [Patescibacteria group bacterium]|nr:Mur ligase family protein [Patescibacteria group bacterium]
MKTNKFTIEKKWFLEGPSRYSNESVYRFKAPSYFIQLKEAERILNKYKIRKDDILLSHNDRVSSWELAVKIIFRLTVLPLTFFDESKIDRDSSLVVFDVLSKELGSAISEEAEKLVNSGFTSEILSVIEKIKLIYGKQHLNPILSRYIAEAKKRNIPCITLMKNPVILQLGYGKKAKKVWSALTSKTTRIGAKLTANKHVLNTLLNKLDIPVTISKVLQNEDDLKILLQEMPLPVVIKPADSTVGKGVSLNIRTLAQAKRAYKTARKISKKVIMENQVDGTYYRLAFVDGKMIACAKSFPVKIIGDGHKTVKELIEEENKKPYRQAEDKNKSFYKIEITDKLKAILSFQEMKLSSLVPKDQEVMLSFSGADGGEWIEDNSSVHSENIKLIQRALHFSELDVAGVDVISPDISIPFRENGGKILEINAGPDTNIHANVNQGEKIIIERAILNYLFSEDENGRIPIVSITGTNGKTTTAKLLAFLLQDPSRRTIGLTTSDNKYINSDLVSIGDKSGFLSAQSLLMNNQIDIAILETCHILGIDKRGLGYDWSDASIITNLSGDHVGTFCTRTEDELFAIKSVVAKRTKKNGYLILNADDPKVVQMARFTQAKIAFFALSRENEFIQKNLEQRLPVYYAENNCFYEENNGIKTKLADIKDIQIAHSGEATFNLYNTLGSLAATRLVFGDMVSLDEMQEKLKVFGKDFGYNPGRFNIIQKDGFKVIIDYAHNHDGYKNTIKLAKKIKHSRFIGVIKSAGDRPDNFIRELGAIAGQNFDYIYIKDPSAEKIRGRQKGEVASLLKEGVLTSEFQKENIRIILDESEAVKTALMSAKPGDLILIFAHNIPETIEQVQNF